MFLRNLIYILQLNLYENKSFLRFSYTHPTWWKLEKRATLVWTIKASLIYALSVFFLIVVLALSFWRFGYVGFFVIFLEFVLLPLIISLTNLIMYPLDKYFKKRLIVRAKRVLQKFKEVTVIGIAGSYGKTSTREILATILGTRFNVFKLEENINTEVGIADFIVKNPNFLEGKDIFIVEAGAYKRGDIKDICDLVHPEYSILTGINESHKERFGSFENIIQAKFELPLFTEKMSVLNLDNERVKKNYKRFNIRNVAEITKDEVKNVRILENFSGISFEIDGINFQTKLLAKHNISLILAAKKIAETLGMEVKEITSAVSKIEYIPHRLEPIYNKRIMFG